MKSNNDIYNNNQTFKINIIDIETEMKVHFCNLLASWNKTANNNIFLLLIWVGIRSSVSEILYLVNAEEIISKYLSKRSFSEVL